MVVVMFVAWLVEGLEGMTSIYQMVCDCKVVLSFVLIKRLHDQLQVAILYAGYLKWKQTTINRQFFMLF
jgi:hypothetical protein